MRTADERWSLFGGCRQGTCLNLFCQFNLICSPVGKTRGSLCSDLKSYCFFFLIIPFLFCLTACGELYRCLCTVTCSCTWRPLRYQSACHFTEMRVLQLPAPYRVALELFMWHLMGRALVERPSLTLKLFWYRGATWSSQKCMQSCSVGATGVIGKTRRIQRGLRGF